MLWWILTLSLTTAVQCRIYSTGEKLKMFTVLGGTVTVKLDYSAGVKPLISCSSNDNLLQQPVLAGSVVTEMNHLKTYLLRLHFLNSIVTCHLVPYVKDRDTLANSLCPRLTCPPGWDLLQDTCFLISEDLRSWAEGQSFCGLKGGSLATISSDVQQEALSRMLTEDTWIGLRHQPTINESHWDDRSAYTYSRWAHGKPKNTLDMEGCVTMSERYNFLWDTAECDYTKRFMCSVKGLATTSVSQNKDRPISFFIKNQSFNKTDTIDCSNITTTTSTAPNTTTTTATIITTTTATNTTSITAPNTTTTSTAPNTTTTTTAPNTTTTTTAPNTTTTTTAPNTTTTTTAPNTTTITNTTAAPTTTTIRTRSKRCPTSWPKFQRNCYKVFEESVDYATAVSRCSAKGAHLAIITSEEEHWFLRVLLRNDAYIGLTDIEMEGTFKWNDGSPLRYTRWSVGEPTDHFGEDCVEMSKFFKFEWTAINCDRVRHFVCEKSRK